MGGARDTSRNTKVIDLGYCSGINVARNLAMGAVPSPRKHKYTDEAQRWFETGTQIAEAVEHPYPVKLGRVPGKIGLIDAHNGLDSLTSPEARFLYKRHHSFPAKLFPGFTGNCVDAIAVIRKFRDPQAFLSNHIDLNNCHDRMRSGIVGFSRGSRRPRSIWEDPSEQESQNPSSTRVVLYWKESCDNATGKSTVARPFLDHIARYHNSLPSYLRVNTHEDLPEYMAEFGKTGCTYVVDSLTKKVVSFALLTPASTNKNITWQSTFTHSLMELNRTIGLRRTQAEEALYCLGTMTNPLFYSMAIHEWLDGLDHEDTEQPFLIHDFYATLGRLVDKPTGGRFCRSQPSTNRPVKLRDYAAGLHRLHRAFDRANNDNDPIFEPSTKAQIEWMKKLRDEITKCATFGPLKAQNVLASAIQLGLVQAAPALDITIATRSNAMFRHIRNVDKSIFKTEDDFFRFQKCASEYLGCLLTTTEGIICEATREKPAVDFFIPGQAFYCNKDGRVISYSFKRTAYADPPEILREIVEPIGFRDEPSEPTIYWAEYYEEEISDEETLDINAFAHGANASTRYKVVTYYPKSDESRGTAAEERFLNAARNVCTSGIPYQEAMAEISRLFCLHQPETIDGAYDRPAETSRPAQDNETDTRASGGGNTASLPESETLEASSDTSVFSDIEMDEHSLQVVMGVQKRKAEAIFDQGRKIKRRANKSATSKILSVEGSPHRNHSFGCQLSSRPWRNPSSKSAPNLRQHTVDAALEFALKDPPDVKAQVEPTGKPSYQQLCKGKSVKNVEIDLFLMGRLILNVIALGKESSDNPLAIKKALRDNSNRTSPFFSEPSPHLFKASLSYVDVSITEGFSAREITFHSCFFRTKGSMVACFARVGKNEIADVLSGRFANTIKTNDNTLGEGNYVFFQNKDLARYFFLTCLFLVGSQRTMTEPIRKLVCETYLGGESGPDSSMATVTVEDQQWYVWGASPHGWLGRKRSDGLPLFYFMRSQATSNSIYLAIASEVKHQKKNTQPKTKLHYFPFYTYAG